jgi:hypothetical protein
MAGYSIRQKLPSQAVVVVDAIVDDGRVVAMRFDSFLRMFMCRARARKTSHEIFRISVDPFLDSDGFRFRIRFRISFVYIFYIFWKRPKCAGDYHGKVVSGVKGCSSGSI